MERKVLYIDPDESERDKLSKLFKSKEDLKFEAVGTKADALSFVEKNDIRCLVMESEFSSEDLNDIMQEVEAQRSNVVPILFTDQDFGKMPAETVMGFSAYVSKQDEDAYQNLVDEISSLLKSRAEVDYPVPDNEEKRVEAVEELNIGSLMNSEGFKRLSRIGSEVFKTKWCFIGLITDERERFLSFEGSDTEELERSCTMCTFAINQTM